MILKTTKSFFITGTGTGVGKTLVTAGLAGLLISRGKRVSVMKPVQTGTSSSATDIETISGLVPGLHRLPASTEIPYSFPLAASPALASSQERKRIEPLRIREAYWAAMACKDIDMLLVEGAGGLMVPLNDRLLMIDLISLLQIQVILVCTAGLGTVNHTLLSIDALERRKIPVAGIVVNRMPSNPGAVERDNVRTIGRRSGIPVLAVVAELSAGTTAAKTADFAGELLSCMKRQKPLLQMFK